MYQNIAMVNLWTAACLMFNDDLRASAAKCLFQAVGMKWSTYSSNLLFLILMSFSQCAICTTLILGTVGTLSLISQPLYLARLRF